MKTSNMCLLEDAAKRDAPEAWRSQNSMKSKVVIFVAMIFLGCIASADIEEVLRQQINDPCQLIRIDLLSDVPTETVAAKLALFKDALLTTYNIDIPIYVDPLIATNVIKGWQTPFVTGLPIGKASIEDTLRLFTEFTGLSFRTTNELILIEKGCEHVPAGDAVPLRGQRP